MTDDNQTVTATAVSIATITTTTTTTPPSPESPFQGKWAKLFRPNRDEELERLEEERRKHRAEVEAKQATLPPRQKRSKPSKFGGNKNTRPYKQKKNQPEAKKNQPEATKNTKQHPQTRTKKNSY